MVKSNILWIEDDADQIFGLVAPLIEAGYNVDTVRDYENAKRIISEKKYDLIILDIIISSGKVVKSEQDLNEIHTGDYYGIKFLESLSENSTPIVVLTVVTDPDILNQINEFPNVEAIQDNKGKIKPSELKAIVLNVLKKRAKIK